MRFLLGFLELLVVYVGSASHGGSAKHALALDMNSIAL
jgi:hypothetical protein